MMTLQAREWTKGAHRLRHYPADSTRARARLAVLAIIAGGNTDIRTFDALEQHGEFRTLDLERDDFLRTCQPRSSNKQSTNGTRASDQNTFSKQIASLVDGMQGNRKGFGRGSLSQ